MRMCWGGATFTAVVHRQSSHPGGNYIVVFELSDAYSIKLLVYDQGRTGFD
jgi:hypothetical protein